MKIITAFDSFKGCMSAIEACRAAEEGIKAVHADATVINLPMSDGGEGLVDCLAASLPHERITVEVHDPLMRPHTAEYIVNDGTAYMEMAAASGLTLVAPEERDIMAATTYGVGEMLADAISRGYRHIVMGIGGSATCDAGEGMITSLKDNGFIDPQGRMISRKWSDCQLNVACDVQSPLFGPDGAAYVFAPQKGATPSQVAVLDDRLRQFAAHTERLGVATSADALAPGAGAAGGLGYALRSYLGAQLVSGIDLVLRAVGFDEHLQAADMVFTGEGCSDTQTLLGKVPMGVLRAARAKHVPVHILSGKIEGTEALLTAGFASVQSINPPHAVDVLNPVVAQRNMKASARDLLPSIIE